MTIREVQSGDLFGLLELYTMLHEKSVPEDSEKLRKLWSGIIADKNHHIIVADDNGKIVSTCVCVIIPNLTHELRPYAIVENVVTHEDYRNRGLASACLNKAKEIAVAENCYKLMLMTGSKRYETLPFYERAGYDRNDKTGFIQWI